MNPIEKKTKEWLAACLTPAYLEAESDRDPAVVKARQLKKELDQLEFEALSPKAKLRELVEGEIVQERQEQAEAAAEQAARENAQAEAKAPPPQ